LKKIARKEAIGGWKEPKKQINEKMEEKERLTFNVELLR